MIEKEKPINELLRALFQGVKRLFFLVYFVAGPTADEEAGIKDNRKYFLPKGEINNCNVFIDGRHFYVQPINEFKKQYNEVRKVSIGQGDDYTPGCLLDYSKFKDNYRLTAVHLTKQKALDADSRAI